MNPPCTIETGLFKKAPCGQLSVTKCASCEQALCKQHAVAQKKPGIFLCKECDIAQKQYEKDQAKHDKEKREAEMMKGVSPVKKPATPAAGHPPAAAPAKAAPPAAPAEPIPDTIEYRPEPKKK